MRADLHVHSYYSDGLCSPEQLVIGAKSNGVNLISVTDHDTMLAADEVKTLCLKNGLKSVSGIEVSAYLNGVKIHTLGYGLNPENPSFKSFLSELAEGSDRRLDDILNKLDFCGVRLSKEDVQAEKFCELSPAHGMHIARAGAKKGYAENAFSFYAKYLALGKPAFSDIARPSPEYTVGVIKESGGFSSLAHPGRIELEKEQLKSLIKRLKDLGLGGIEAVYSAHTLSDTVYYKEMARSFNLLVTGGSDTHYIGGKRSIGTPEFKVEAQLAEALKL